MSPRPWWMHDCRMARASTPSFLPLALDGPSLSIRRFGGHKLSVQAYQENGTLTKPMMDLLADCVKGKLNIMVSGGTGAGKTTLLNVLSSFIPDNERIVTIEDAAELRLKQQHVVRLETRPPNIEGKGAIKQRHLVMNALRMRPDRIIVGEVRGEEAVDMLQAMNTGHEGSLTTIHANSPRDALSRLETMIAMAELNLPDRAVRQQIASAINLIVQVSRLPDGSRRVTNICEVTGMEGPVITTQDLFVFERAGYDEKNRVRGTFPANRNPTQVHGEARVVRHSLRSGHVLQGDRKGRALTMLLPVLAIIVFLITFALATSFFFLFVETPLARRKMMTRLSALQEVAVRQRRCPRRACAGNCSATCRCCNRILADCTWNQQSAPCSSSRLLSRCRWERLF